MNSHATIVSNVLLGLTVQLFGPEPTLRDTCIIAHARLHLWPGWPQQAAAVQQDVADFLRSRTDAFTDDRALLAILRRRLADGSDFEVLAMPGSARPGWLSRFRLVPGRPLNERLTEWLEMSKSFSAAGGARALQLSVAGEPIRLTSHELSFTIPPDHISRSLSIRSITTAPDSKLEFEVASLRALARRIDAGGSDDVSYEKVAIDQFLRAFNQGPRTAFSYQAGDTWLAVAPTGTGKSVFARLLVLELTQRGIPSALVVPDIASSWKEVLRLEDAAARAGLKLRIAVVNSWRSMAEHLARHLDAPPVEDASGQRMLLRMAYSCLLGAYADGSGPRPGQEPCMSLRQLTDSSTKPQRVPCPFVDSCGRFSAFESALTADVIVVNQDAFLLSRVPFEVSADGGPAKRMSTLELALRRCGVVLIDEIDALQRKASSASSRMLPLSSSGRLSKAMRLLVEAERRRAEGRADRDQSFEQGRNALMRVVHESERLTELVGQNEMRWPEGSKLTWRDANDGWLSEKLFGARNTQTFERLRQLYDPWTAIVGEPRSESIRQALAHLVVGFGDGTPFAEVQADIQAALGGLSATQRDRDRLASRLIARANLDVLDRGLADLLAALPALEDGELPQASELRDNLLGYTPWQLSPAGPLGRRLFGYALDSRRGEMPTLETRIISGDPAGFIKELGSQASRALAGQPRVVLGFSATCRFRGAPSADVLGRVAGWVTDTARNVRIFSAPVGARISGMKGAKRLQQAEESGRLLWSTTLNPYLVSKLNDPEHEGRARALLVTGSYLEAEAVARGLRSAAGPALRIRFVVRNAGEAERSEDALPRTHLETFGQVVEPAVLIAPLDIVARGHNILQPGRPASAISGIFVLTRPVPPLHDARRFVSHLAYNARMFPVDWRGEPGPTVMAERAATWGRLRDLQSSPATFRHMLHELRRELICDVLSDLAQLVGRARRGGTSADLIFVDEAFQDAMVPWQQLIHDVLIWWQARGWLSEMLTLHGAFVTSLAAYANFSLPRSV